MCNSFFDITLIVIMWKIYIALVSRLQYDGDSNTGVLKTCHNAYNVTFLRMYLLWSLCTLNLLVWQLRVAEFLWRHSGAN